MSQTRTTGLLLLLTGFLTFLGTTNQMLPAEAFFPAVVVCLLGVVVFLKSSRTAPKEAEQGTPDRTRARVRNRAPADPPEKLDQQGAAYALPVDPTALGDQGDDGDFVVSTDVSFPAEAQQHQPTQIADQLAKLRRLADDGIISEDEFAIAKAKLLD